MHTLKIDKINVNVEGKQILKDFSLTINSGEIHVIMGPNGTGKSTLTKVIMGDKKYEITSGKIYYDDQLLNDLTPDKRSKLGIFLGMQNPVEIDGVTNADFLKAAVFNNDFKLFDFIKEINSTYEKMDLKKEMIHRSVNKGFSGGEKKKNEIVQMYMLKPSFIMLDEIDSGLDVDSLKLVGESVKEYYDNSESSILLITHYNRLLDYIKPDFVHVMINGTIAKTSSFDLVKEIEENGYGKYIDEK